MEETIKRAIEEALLSVGGEGISFVVEWPADLSHGDYATNVALVASKKLGRAPKEIADEIAPKLKELLSDSVQEVSVAGPGFINFVLKRDQFSNTLHSIVEGKASWGRSTQEEGKRVMVEYGNPNTFKEMHVGHLMGNVIGEAIARLSEHTGCRVYRDTFGGDVGPNVAKALWGLHRKGITSIGNAKEISDAYADGSRAYEESEKAKEEIDALNTKIYELVENQEKVNSFSPEDRELYHLWLSGREISMQEHMRIFEILGSSYDYVFFDSDTTAIGMRVVQDGITKGVFEESEGAVVYKGEKKGLHTLVFITSRGTPLYPTKDVGLAFLKEERHPTDEVVILTGLEQTGHFNVTLAALSEIAPKLAEKMVHIPHGLLELPDGKMSSRKGNVITGASLIEEMIERLKEKNEDPLIRRQVAIGAIKYMILRQTAGANIVFDPEQSLSLEGDSGPYLQYALVRAKTVLEKAEKKGDSTPPESPYLLERLLVRFPEVVLRAERERSPHYVTQYLTTLAGEWNAFYAKERIIGGDHEGYKLLLAEAFVTTMENGLYLLGIPAPEKM